MHANYTLDIATATDIVTRALQHESQTIACAVVGSRGELIAFGAQDGATAMPRKLAVRKAYSSLHFKRETVAVREAIASGAIDLPRLNDPELLAIPGGVAVWKGDSCVGAIGISGLVPDDDQELARQLVPGDI